MATQQTITLQVTCITKLPNHHDPHTRIQGIGGYGNGGWWHTEDAAIANIKAGRARYYVHVGTHSVWVIVATHRGREYLKTEADGYSPDNLLSLPPCR